MVKSFSRTADFSIENHYKEIYRVVNKRLYRPCGGCRFRRDPKLLAARAARLAEAEAEDADAKTAAEAWFEEQVKVKANSRGSSVMSIIQVVIAASDFIVCALPGRLSALSVPRFLYSVFL